MSVRGCSLPSVQFRGFLSAYRNPKKVKITARATSPPLASWVQSGAVAALRETSSVFPTVACSSWASHLFLTYCETFHLRHVCGTGRITLINPAHFARRGSLARYRGARRIGGGSHSLIDLSKYLNYVRFWTESAED